MSNTAEIIFHQISDQLEIVLMFPTACLITSCFAVAAQCLETAFEVSTDDQSLAIPMTLPEIFASATAKVGSLEQGEVSCYDVFSPDVSLHSRVYSLCSCPIVSVCSSFVYPPFSEPELAFMDSLKIIHIDWGMSHSENLSCTVKC